MADGDHQEPREFEVALSYAGEQRGYVGAVAAALREKNIKVFYDSDQANNLWGKDGAEHFHYIYSEGSRYVVMFISSDYVSKAWPRHERRSAISRQMKEDREFILPVRFDHTAVPGLPDTLQYLLAARFSPADLAVEIAEKVRSPSKIAQFGPPDALPTDLFYRPVTDGAATQFRMGIERAASTSPAEFRKAERCYLVAARGRHPEGLLRAFTFLELRTILGDSPEEEQWGERQYFIEELAEDGNAWGQFDLGSAKRFGWGSVEKDQVSSIKLLTAAANKGVPDAQNELADILYFDDHPSGIDLYRRAAVAGNVAAQYSLSYLLPGEVEKLQFLRMAAESGHSSAQKTLADSYLTGTKVLDRDVEKARLWYKRAEPSAGSILGIWTIDHGISSLTVAGSALEAASRKGDRVAQFALGASMLEGENGFEKDEPLGLSLVKTSAELGYGPAQVELCTLHHSGRHGAKRSPKEAKKWAAHAAEQRLPLGISYMGISYLLAKDERGYPEAIRLLREASKLGEQQAQFTLSVLLAHGIGCAANPAESLAWMQKAGDRNGDGRARLVIGLFRSLFL